MYTRLFVVYHANRPFWMSARALDNTEVNHKQICSGYLTRYRPVVGFFLTL